MMLKRPVTWFIVFVFAILIFAVVTLYQFNQSYSRHAVRTQLSAWALAQMELETLEFRHELALYLHTQRQNRSALILKYDILWSRYDTFLRSSETEELRQAFSATPLVTRAFQIIRRYEQAVLEGQTTRLQQLLSEMDTLLPALRDLMINNLTGPAAIKQREYLANQLKHIYLAVGLILTLLGYFSWRMYRDSLKQQQMAWMDSVTQLPNRNYLLDALQKAATKKAIHTLLVIDIRRFKDINDLLGYEQGDHALTKLAQRLNNICSPYGYTCARLSGNRFAVLAAVDGHYLSFFTQPLRDTLRNALDDIYPNIQLTVALGIAKSTDLDTALRKDPEVFANTLLNNADLALLKAKDALPSKDSIVVFKPKFEADARQRRQLKDDLNVLLVDESQDELSLVYQPIISSEPDKLGCEALIRWQHPTLGPIRPQLLIDVAEEAGLGQRLGTWILRQVYAAMNTEWQTINQHIDVAINLSDSFFSEALLSDVVNIFIHHPEQRKRLVFEITETMTIDDIGRFSLIMNQLRDIGIRLALDDFGTGWSSMAVLNHLSFDKVKIDRSFIEHMATVSRQQILVDTICYMSHQLGIRVVAEGVETQEQLINLQQMGVDEFQGYYFSKPLNAIDFYAFCIDHLSKQNTFSLKN
ncbi:putative bifunctional diguanylate cyclase/phosphodiesterase [Salinivibrio sp. PR5]|uniref:putative bifunctional diguanylate cyclase/phosphodiesterase n=1 Tax=Salinivibrio sp. PR5 TaxID=1909484 RepID=UPI000989C45C|nr:GGDEF domain-containing phosphodiesterase [Salinivibrio sp. PR5]